MSAAVCIVQIYPFHEFSCWTEPIKIVNWQLLPTVNTVLASSCRGSSQQVEFFSYRIVWWSTRSLVDRRHWSMWIFYSWTRYCSHSTDDCVDAGRPKRKMAVPTPSLSRKPYNYVMFHLVCARGVAQVLPFWSMSNAISCRYYSREKGIWIWNYNTTVRPKLYSCASWWPNYKYKYNP